VTVPLEGPSIGAIADDLTGATDLALTLSRGGMRVCQSVGLHGNSAPDAWADADAVVVALKSRTIPANQAVAQSVAAASALMAAGVRQLFFKYCSTFDSTDEGNIGPVIEALLAHSGQKRTLVCPAFPANGRTVYKGYLFVGNQLLSDSGMKDHPLTPMRDASIVRMLGRQTKLPVSLIEIETVRQGAETLRAALDVVPGVAVIDALDDADLQTIASAASGIFLITGGSGVAQGLPANHGYTGGAVPGGRSVGGAVPKGRAVVLAGSCSLATLRQIEVAKAGGMPSFRLNPLAEGWMGVQEAVGFAMQTHPGRVPLIYSSADAAAVRHAQNTLGRLQVGEMLEQAMGEIAAALADHGFERIVVAGGETSGAVIEKLGITDMYVGPEIDPGVPWMLTYYRGRPVALALKSGNFGADDIFLAAWEKLA
jgi:3-dehydrotetronate 4-kinase